MPEHIKAKLAEEIKALEHELTTELPAEIKKAVVLGDLSENAEYHMAKQRQVFVNARLGQLKKRMGELAMVNLANIPHDKVGFGSRITVFDSSKEEEIVYQLVTSEESDVSEGLDLNHVAHWPCAAGHAGWRRSDRGDAERQARPGNSEACDDPRCGA